MRKKPRNLTYTRHVGRNSPQNIKEDKKIRIIISIIILIILTYCSVQDITPPGEVSELISIFGDSFITLNWKEPLNSDFAFVEITYIPNGTTPITITKGITNTTINDLINGTLYTFTVKTVDTSGNKSNGRQINSTPNIPDITPPSEVTNLIASASNKMVTLSWIDPIDNDFNIIEIIYTPNPITPIIINKGIQTKTISNLINGTEYTFTIKTIDNSNNKSVGLQIIKTPILTGIWIYSVTATPTEAEQVTIVNYYNYTYDLTGWTIGDLNNPTAYSIPNGTMLNQNETKTFSHTTLGFGINDSGETIYLKNDSGETIDTWYN